MNKPKTTPILSKVQNLLTHQTEAEVLFMSIGDGAITTDEFGRITRVNPAAENMLGFNEAELLGQWFLKSIVAISFEGHRMTVIDQPITQAFLTGKPVSGKQIPVAVNVSPIISQKRPIGAIEVFRDISMEQEVDRMKSEFISLASHQLRTPLSAIKTYTHMLSDGYMGELNDSQKQSLKTIISASNRMNELISTLLNITRIESGTIAVNTKSLKLDEVINEIMPELILMADAKTINLHVDTVGKESTQIKTDSLIVKEVITNLISNAIKYTPDEGEVKVVIKPQRSNITVEVSDSGWGIPVHAHDKVFSKFFRGSNIIKRETSGTGLGLYLVKGLVDTLKGTIWFDSEEGNGTSFYVTLPKSMKEKPATKVVAK
jgi:PAS domain S-box-containing protein